MAASYKFEIYKDKSGEWKGSNSLSLNELPKAITALQQAYEYLLASGNPEVYEDDLPPIRSRRA